MKALVYDLNPAGWLTCRILRRFWPGCLLTRLNGLSLRQIPTPELPGEDWVLVRTLLGGICGTDLAILRQKQPIDSILPSYSSMPMLFGHENVAVVERTGLRVDPGWIHKRVCVEPTLHCGVRGIEPPCPRCRAGQFGACENFGAEGAGTSRLPAGTSIGYNRRTGGSYGEFFVAHQSQLVEAPAELADEELVLTDPAACSLHAVLRANLDQAEQILVYGGGVIGLTTVAGLRALGYGGRIDVVERSDFAGTWAEPMGANRLLRLPPGERQRFEAVAAASGGTVRRSRFSRCMLNGGYDIVFECVGSSRSIDESLKWTRARGQVILVGTDAGRRVDLTPIWFRELTIRGVYGRQQEEYQDRRIGTYQLTHELMVQKKLRLGGLLTHRYPVRQYKEAFTTALNKDAHRAMKVAFDFREHKG